MKESPSLLVGELRLRLEMSPDGTYANTIYQSFVGNEGTVMDSRAVSTDQFYTRLQAEVNSKLLLLCNRLLKQVKQQKGL